MGMLQPAQPPAPNLVVHLDEELRAAVRRDGLDLVFTNSRPRQMGCQTDRVPREYQSPAREILEWVRHQVHARARVIAVAPLPGGLTADMDRITVGSPRGSET